MRFDGTIRALRLGEIDSAPSINFVNFASFVDLDWVLS
jgi:hypothetical protein